MKAIAQKPSTLTGDFLPQTGQSDTKKATGVKATDAADAYEHILTIQNAADLELPATNPANAAARAEFKRASSCRIITSRPQPRRRQHHKHRQNNFLQIETTYPHINIPKYEN